MLIFAFALALQTPQEPQENRTRPLILDFEPRDPRDVDRRVVAQTPVFEVCVNAFYPHLTRWLPVSAAIDAKHSGRCVLVEIGVVTGRELEYCTVARELGRGRANQEVA